MTLWSRRKEAFSIEANCNRARVTEREEEGRRKRMHKNQIRGNVERNERAKDRKFRRSKLRPDHNNVYAQPKRAGERVMGLRRRLYKKLRRSTYSVGIERQQCGDPCPRAVMSKDGL